MVKGKSSQLRTPNPAAPIWRFGGENGQRESASCAGNAPQSKMAMERCGKVVIPWGNIGTFWRIMCNRVTFIAMFDYRMANLERVQARVLLFSRRSRDYIVYNITLSISVC